MRKNVQRSAGMVLLTISSLATVFHVLVLSGLIDYRLVWGGRLKNPQEMQLFEVVSLVVNVCIMWLTAQRIRIVKAYISQRILKWVFILLTVLFVLNTLGNLLSLNRLEAWIFTPVTCISALCCLWLVRSTEQH